MKETRIYRCDDTPEAIFTAVYDAGKSAYGHDHIRLEVNMPEAEQNYTLFSEYVDVVPDPEKMTKVLRTVRRQISQQAYEYIMVAAGIRNGSLSMTKSMANQRFIIPAGNGTCAGWNRRNVRC